MVDLSNVGGLGVLAMVAVFFKEIRSFVVRAITTGIRTDEVEGIHAGYTARHIMCNYKHFGLGGTKFSSAGVFYKPKGFYISALFGHKDVYVAFVGWRRAIPIMLTSSSMNELKITYFPGLVDLESLIRGAIELEYIPITELDIKRAESSPRFYFVKYNGSLGENLLKPPKSEDSSAGGERSISPSDDNRSVFGYIGLMRDCMKIPFGNLPDFVEQESKSKSPSYFWSDEAETFYEELKFWYENRNWFQTREVPWRHGVLLYGKPGTGKSRLIYNACVRADTPLCIFELSSMTNKDFIEKMDNIPQGSVVLFEDVDTVFEGRTNKYAKDLHNTQPLTFDCLINALSGAQEKNGIFTVVTTNYKENLDTALTRPGRLDAHIEVQLLSEKGRKFVAGNILRDWPDEIDDAVRRKTSTTVAEFESYCVERARKLFYTQKKAQVE